MFWFLRRRRRRRTLPTSTPAPAPEMAVVPTPAPRAKRAKREDFTPEAWEARRAAKRKADNDRSHARIKERLAAESPEEREVRLAEVARKNADPVVREKNRQRAARYYAANKAACHARATEYWRAHKTEAAVREKRWRDENKHKVRSYEHNRRALEVQTPMNPERVKALRKERICYYCGVGMTLEPKHVCTLTIDHLIPLTRGGTNADENLVAACLSCNSGKCDLLPEEFFAKMAADRAKPVKTKFRKNRPRLQT